METTGKAKMVTPPSE